MWCFEQQLGTSGPLLQADKTARYKIPLNATESLIQYTLSQMLLDFQARGAGHKKRRKVDE